MELLLSEAFWLVALLSFLPLAASSAVGFVCTLLQATTQLQEQAIVYIARLLAVCSVLLFAGGWMMTQMVQFLHAALGSFVQLGGG